MFGNKFSKISDLAWDQKNVIEDVKKNKKILKYIIETHIIILTCTVIYGAVLGFYVKDWQILLNALKIPILFLVTLYIAMPVIFIIDVLLENKINFHQISILLLLGFTNTSMVLIAFTPLMFFFILTTVDYSFIVILNIAICSFAGYFGIISILSSFKHFHKEETWNPSLTIGSFIIIFVGTQLAWTLRPFFHSYSEFTKPISGNFYVALGRILQQNPNVALVIVGIFMLIALFVTISRMIIDSELEKDSRVAPNPEANLMDKKGRKRKGKGKLKQKHELKVKESENYNYPAYPPYPAGYYPSNIWGIAQSLPPQVPPNIPSNDKDNKIVRKESKFSEKDNRD